MIEPARGETSRGVCRRCGEVKDFANDISSLYMLNIDSAKCAKGGKSRNSRNSLTRNPVYSPISAAYELAEIRG
jgi:hypothetical protein